jgi:hypothetical protein
MVSLGSSGFENWAKEYCKLRKFVKLRLLKLNDKSGEVPLYTITQVSVFTISVKLKLFIHFSLLHVLAIIR